MRYCQWFYSLLLSESSSRLYTNAAIRHFRSTFSPTNTIISLCYWFIATEHKHIMTITASSFMLLIKNTAATPYIIQQTSSVYLMLICTKSSYGSAEMKSNAWRIHELHSDIDWLETDLLLYFLKTDKMFLSISNLCGSAVTFREKTMVVLNSNIWRNIFIGPKNARRFHGLRHPTILWEISRLGVALFDQWPQIWVATPEPTEYLACRYTAT